MTDGTARFRSIESWVHPDVKGLHAGRLIDGARYRLLQKARQPSCGGPDNRIAPPQGELRDMPPPTTRQPLPTRQRGAGCTECVAPARINLSERRIDPSGS